MWTFIYDKTALRATQVVKPSVFCVKDKVYADAPQSIQELKKEDSCRYRRIRAPIVRKCNGKFLQKNIVLQT